MLQFHRTAGRGVSTILKSQSTLAIRGSTTHLAPFAAGRPAPYSTAAPERILGVEAALKAQSDPSYEVKPQIFEEFALPGGVSIITGANGGLGLEMSLALIEAGSQVYAIDLPPAPSPDFLASQAYAKRLGSSLTYISADVTDQPGISSTILSIARKHGRLDACVAAAGILGKAAGDHCTEYSAEAFRKVMDINCNGVFFTAAAAAKGMMETGTKGSIVLIASMSGSITNKDHPWVAYNTSKSAVLQMGRSMACELGKDGIRVNTISPGHIYTKMTAALLDVDPAPGEVWKKSNPLGRLGKVHEVRGVVTWLASSASSFCTGSDIIVSGGHHSW